MQQFIKVEQHLCRTHGVATTKAFLKKTVVQGWWGLISFFVNFFVIFSDVLVLRKCSALAEPELDTVVETFAAPA